MSLQLQFEDPHGVEPLQAAYAWISYLAVDFSTLDARLVLSINQDAAGAAAGKPPVGRAELRGGQVLVPAEYDEEGAEITPAVLFPTLAELMADPEFAQAFGVIRAKLYAVVKLHPTFTDAVDVE